MTISFTMTTSARITNSEDKTTELVAAQGKIQRAESQFAIAVQRRALEIDQEKAKYASLLQ